MDRIRLGHLIYSPALGGSEMLAVEVCSRLDRSAFDPTVLFMYPARGPLPGILAGKGIPWVALRHTRLHRWLGPWLHARKLKRLALDVLHVHHIPLYDTIRPALSRAGIRRTVLTEHAFYSISRSPALQEASRRAIREVPVFTAVSDSLKEYLVGTLGAPGEAIQVIRNGVDLAKYAPGKRNGKLAGILPSGVRGPVAISVGRLAAAKDQAGLLAAWKILQGEGSAPYLVLVGDGDLRGVLEEEVRRLGLGDRVLLAGGRSDVPELLGGADLFVLSSRREGLPMAILEALAMGLPVVATRVGGIPEAIVDGGNGLLVPPEKPAALAAAVRRIMTEEGLGPRLALAGRKTVEERFSLDAVTSRYSTIYRDLLAARSEKDLPESASVS